MSDVVLIAPAEIALALRLTGLAVLSAGNAAEASEHLRDIRGRGEVELVLLPEHWLPDFDRDTYREVLAGDHPYAVPLPLDWQATRDPRADFESRLGCILGRRINLPAQPPHDAREARADG
jgi:vacuolar-type H+-ATPase subunit F/Vma7